MRHPRYIAATLFVATLSAAAQAAVAAPAEPPPPAASCPVGEFFRNLGDQIGECTSRAFAETRNAADVTGRHFQDATRSFGECARRTGAQIGVQSQRVGRTIGEAAMEIWNSAMGRQ